MFKYPYYAISDIQDLTDHTLNCGKSHIESGDEGANDGLSSKEKATILGNNETHLELINPADLVLA